MTSTNVLGYHRQFGPATMQAATAKSLSVLEWSLFHKLEVMECIACAKRGHSVNRESKMSKYRPITDLLPFKAPPRIPFYQNAFICCTVPSVVLMGQSALAFVVFLVLERILNLQWSVRSHFKFFLPGFLKKLANAVTILSASVPVGFTLSLISQRRVFHG